jgi:FMN phosphatase YigB (HAD superfamily)
MKKYLAIDIGNVLVYANTNKFKNKLSKILNIPLEEANYFLNRVQKLHDLGFTHLLDELHDHFAIKSSVIIDELLDEWNNVIVPCPEIISRLEKMIDRDGLQIALLSNIGTEHAALMPTQLGDYLFQNSIKYFSCQVGARKPTMVYYHTFLQLHPEWKGCPYIDDLQENLDASQQFGFKTHRFSLEDMSQSKVELDKLEGFILGHHK